MHQSPMFIQFVPLLLLSVLVGVLAYLLAKEKGRNIPLWTIIGLIPFINFIAVSFFIGAANLKQERMLEEILQRMPPK